MNAPAAVRAIFATDEVATLCRALGSVPGEGETLRLVGGAVRDLYLGRTPKDLDFATTLTPTEVVAACQSFGIGIGGVANGRAAAHGTTVAQVGARIFEITTLRLDAVTDGRHAQVRFTRDWEDDSARRDFTINALYAGANGTIYDYHDGLADLEAHKLRFIGRAADRVAEDALRVLRFYRLHAELRWSDRDHDTKALTACFRDASERLGQVSGERLWAEFSRILAVPSGIVCHKVLSRMQAVSALSAVLGRDLDTIRSGWGIALKAYDNVHSGLTPELKSALTAEGLDITPKQVALARLAILMNGTPGNDGLAQKRFGLSNAERDELTVGFLIASVGQWGIKCQSYYEHGLQGRDDTYATYVADSAAARNRALRKARMQCAITTPAYFRPDVVGTPVFYREFVRAALCWTYRPFHLTAEDLRGLGVADGKEMGEILQEVRDWWARNDRKPTHANCLVRAKSQVSLRRREAYWNTENGDPSR